MSVERIPDDIYRQCVAIAKSYYTMLHRRSELEVEQESLLVNSIVYIS